MAGKPTRALLAYVAPPEGVTILTNIIECAPQYVHIGQAVRVVFLPIDDGRHVPMFTPLAASSDA
jgi:uncharacterized protein